MKDLTLETLVSDKENLERILDNLSEGIFAHDLERRILFFNRAAEEITGFSRAMAYRHLVVVLWGTFLRGQLLLSGWSTRFS